MPPAEENPNRQCLVSEQTCPLPPWTWWARHARAEKAGTLGKVPDLSHQERLWGQLWWHTLFTPALGSQEQVDLYQFEGSLVYIVSFRQWLHSETWTEKSESWGWGYSSVGRMFAWDVQSPGIDSQHPKKPGELLHTCSFVFWILATWGIQGPPGIPATLPQKKIKIIIK